MADTREASRTGAFANAWAILSSGERQSPQIALAIVSIVTMGFGGCLAVFLYGFFARQCFDACGFWSLARSAGGFVALFAAVGAFSAGGMLGLLFGSPRSGGAGTTDASTPDAAAADAPAPEAAAPGVVAPAVKPGEADKTGSSTPSRNANGSSAGMGVRPNTSLERMADWLTTMIVGVGLVHLTTIGVKVQAYGAWVTRAITSDPTSGDWIPGVAISVSFAFAGFLMVYLWSLRFLPSELAIAYERGIVDRVVGAVERKVELEVGKKSENLALVQKQTEEIAKTLDEFRAQPMFRIAPAFIEAMENQLHGIGVDTATIKDVRDRYINATKWTDDPMEGFGASIVDGCLITGKVRPEGDGEYAVQVSLQVQDQTLRDIAWLQHNTFSNFYEAAELKDGTATFSILTRGAFWIGVVVARPGRDALRLAIDLATLEGATEEFKNG